MKKVLLILMLTISFGAVDFKEAEKALTDYNLTKQTVQVIFDKADKDIQELTKVIVELQKENNEKDTSNSNTEL